MRKIILKCQYCSKLIERNNYCDRATCHSCRIILNRNRATKYYTKKLSTVVTKSR